MAERRRHKKRIQEVSEPTKEEKAVAKYLRFNCPTKSTNMMGHRVDYFIASKAVDCLLDSKWAKAKKGEEAVFTTRDSVVDYCNKLLKKQFFHRALKVMKKKPEKDIKKDKEKEKEKKKDSKDVEASDVKKEKEKKKDSKDAEASDVKKEKEKEKEKKKDSKDAEASDVKKEKEKEKKKDSKDAEVSDVKKEKSDDSPGTTKKKKDVKKKFKLEPHEDQLFLDGNEVFVWIYDPVHFKTFAMGLILVIAVIAATLFPLWPAEMRVGVYYLSVAAGCFVASILLLAVARCILFVIIWLVTGGRHHFWFLPNLTADVGFIDSFRPLYTHEYKGPRDSSKKNQDKTEGKTSDEKEGDGEEEEEEGEGDEGEGTAPQGTEEGEVAKGTGTLASTAERSDTDSDRREDEGSQHSNGNDFEMITREELEQHTEEEEEEEEGEGDEGEQEGDGERKPLPVQT
ncbi:translocation protein SEC62-like isoform X1 [Salvelinus namaycush]|uniref:Translocation protein SEC62 n=2 Tax=Salvelinus namaycush TaxID=8040 RepID=A0A8U0TKU4_SALNM|nr:translocation protein SEC62-like isoform X1 [Salvelinus namaycush]